MRTANQNDQFSVLMFNNYTAKSQPLTPKECRELGQAKVLKIANAAKPSPTQLSANFLLYCKVALPNSQRLQTQKQPSLFKKGSPFKWFKLYGSGWWVSLVEGSTKVSARPVAICKLLAAYLTVLRRLPLSGMCTLRSSAVSKWGLCSQTCKLFNNSSTLCAVLVHYSPSY